VHTGAALRDEVGDNANQSDPRGSTAGDSMPAMSYRVIRFQETPNPNAVKCVLDRQISDRPRSYFASGEAVGDVLAERLFGIEGVTNVLISGNWITVNKRADVKWGPIRSEVERVLGEAP
jgi:hypothetical protein